MTFEKMCRKKRLFFTEGAANAVARRFGQRTYKCPYCYQFHNSNDVDRKGRK